MARSLPNRLGACPACGAELLTAGDRILPTDYAEGPCGGEIDGQPCGAWVAYHGDEDGRVDVVTGHGREATACVACGGE